MEANFPILKFDTTMPEQDSLWMEGKAESRSAQALRVSRFLDVVWQQPETFVSVTSHGAMIQVFLEVVGHPNANFNLTTGQVMPVLVRGERLEGSRDTSRFMPPTPIETCPLCGPA
jgi:broad specificity phosphatase PhoE